MLLNTFLRRQCLNNIEPATDALLTGRFPAFTCALDPMQFNLVTDTVVVDEAACVPEYAIPQLFALRPKNMILLGNPKQAGSFRALKVGMNSGCLLNAILSDTINVTCSRAFVTFISVAAAMFLCHPK